jgi:hypothetical protein
LQAVVTDHPLNAANANRVASLLKPLGDDLSRCIRIQEAMPNDLALQFTGASIVGLWSAKLALKPQRAVSPKLFQQLKKALFGINRIGGPPQSVRVPRIGLQRAWQACGLSHHRRGPGSNQLARRAWRRNQKTLAWRRMTAKEPVRQIKDGGNWTLKSVLQPLYTC